MTAPQIDHSRSDMERRMRLLEMAKGDLARALELEQWVATGILGNAAPRPIFAGGAGFTSAARVYPAETDTLDIPPFLDRRHAPR